MCTALSSASWMTIDTPNPKGIALAVILDVYPKPETLNPVDPPRVWVKGKGLEFEYIEI